MNDDRLAALASDSRCRLILGGPGVGKTYFGCQIADDEIRLRRIVRYPYQNVLFLTFARNAVARIREAYSSHLAKCPDNKKPNHGDRVRIETFAGFFWWILDSYGRYAPGGSGFRPWLIGSNRIGGEFVPAGHIGYTFDEIQKCAYETIKVPAIGCLISDLYPLVIIDEHQDVDDDLHAFARLLGKFSHLVLLRAPGQCIYQGLKNFDERKIYDKTLNDLNPSIFTIQAQGPNKQRHCGEIAAIIHQYDSHHPCQYDEIRTILKLFDHKTANGIPKELETQAGIMVGRIRRELKSLYPNKALSIAVLTSTNLAAVCMHRRLISGSEAYKLRPIRANLLSEDIMLLQYGRLMLALLAGHWIAYGKNQTSVEQISSMIATLFKAVDDNCSAALTDWLSFSRELNDLVISLKKPKQNDHVLDKLNHDFSKINAYLSATKKQLPPGTPKTPFTAADRYLLQELSRNVINGIHPLIHPPALLNIEKAKKVFESRMSQRILFEKLGLGHGVEVMTIHKAKGLEFDAVVLLLENNRKALWKTTGLTPDKELIDLYRVAISRARDVLAVVAYKDSSAIAKPAVRRLLP